MRTILITAIAAVVLLASTPAQAQIPANYMERMAFGADQAWLSRVQYAVMKEAVAVVQEADSATDHAARFKLAQRIIASGESLETTGRRFSTVIIVLPSVVIQKDVAGGPVYSTLTDTGLSTLVGNIWTQLARLER